MDKNQTILDEAIARALAFLGEKGGEELARSSCVRVGIYVHRPQPPLKPLGINYIITLEKDEQGNWEYKTHQRHIPSIDYARLGNVDPILHYCG